MFARNLVSVQHLLWAQALLAMFLQLAGVPLVKAASCERMSAN